MDYEMSYYLNFVSLVAAAIAAVIGKVAGSAWLTAIAAVAAVLGFLQLAVFFRCPHCHKHLNLRGGLPTECPKCGRKLNQ